MHASIRLNILNSFSSAGLLTLGKALSLCGSIDEGGGLDWWFLLAINPYIVQILFYLEPQYIK